MQRVKQRPVRFLRIHFERIEREAQRAAAKGGREICGVILSNGSFLELVSVRNKTKRGGGFSFYFDEIRSIEKFCTVCQHEIVGTFHSHPAAPAKPGPRDLEHAVHNSLMLIYDVQGRAANLWHIKRRNAKKVQYKLI